MADQDRFDEREQERALVARLSASDPGALAIIMTQYGERLLRFAYSLAGSRDVAEDIVQYVFIRLWDRRAFLDPGSRFKPFLFKAVQNRALDERASDAVRGRYRASVEGEEIAGLRPAAVPSHEERILDQMTIQAAVELLSERRRLAIRLRLEEEMTHAEIAEVLEISLVAAKSLVARAMDDLRDILWGH